MFQRVPPQLVPRFSPKGEIIRVCLYSQGTGLRILFSYVSSPRKWDYTPTNTFQILENPFCFPFGGLSGIGFCFWPERYIQPSPGQRPGNYRINTNVALKGRNKLKYFAPSGLGILMFKYSQGVAPKPLS